MCNGRLNSTFWWDRAVVRFIHIVFLLVLGVFLLIPGNRLQAGSLDFPRSIFGISIGNSREFTGLRINFSDRNVVRVTGINLTFWRARENAKAVVRGISLGIYGPEAGVLRGIQAGLLGVAGHGQVAGISVGGIGVGSTGEVRGVALGGIGVGADTLVRGIALGLVGVGSGGNLEGVAIGGIGVGAMNRVQGIALGLLGVGAGEDMNGVAAGVLGVGAGHDLQGFAVGGVGVGSGNNLTGIFIGGIGVGCRYLLRGVAIGGVAVSAESIHGAAVSVGANGALHLRGVMASLLYNRIRPRGQARGLLLAGYNRVSGKLTGISIGIVNEAEHLHGVQLGLINIIHENPGIASVFPIFNFGK